MKRKKKKDTVETAQTAGVKDSGSTRRSDLVPTGSTLLNLALSNTPYGGYRLGRITNLIGDWHSGKTWLFWQSMAEVVRDKRFDKYDIYYDGAEGATDIPVVDLFGSKILRVDTGKKSVSLEDFFSNIFGLIEKGKPFIYCLDSLDSIFANEQRDKKVEEVGKREIPSEPRVFNSILRRIHDGIDKTESALFVISQTRKAIGVIFGSQQRRAGGDALHFHSWHELWLSIRSQVKKRVRGKDRSVGIIIKIRIEKNKVTGKRQMIQIPLLTDFGLDETGSLIDWLVNEEKIWNTKKEGVKTVIESDFGTLSREALIAHIEEDGLENDLRELVVKEWFDIENATKTNRKKRY